MNVKISFIIPCYNSRNKMKNCLNSFENQTNQSFEAIFIDDCSKDDTHDFLLEYGKNCNFTIKVLKCEQNGGPGQARNKGLENATGDFITFVDSDDKITDNFVQRIVESSELHNFDCLIFDYQYKNKVSLHYNEALMNFEEGFVKTEKAIFYANGGVWGKIYKKEIIFNNNIFFPKLYRSEDIAFSKITISFCSKIYYLKEALYFYCDTADSIMHTSHLVNFNNAIEACNYMKLYANKQYMETIEQLQYTNFTYSVIMSMIIMKKRSKEIRKVVNEFVQNRKNWYKIIKKIDCRKNVKFVLKCFHYNQIYFIKVYYFLLKIYKKI